MGNDLKFGRITTERGDIPADEPLFLIRGKDASAPAAIERYAEEAQAVGAAADLVETCRERAEQIRAWQLAHPERVKVPDQVPGQIVEPGALGYSDDELKGTARDANGHVPGEGCCALTGGPHVESCSWPDANGGLRGVAAVAEGAEFPDAAAAAPAVEHFDVLVDGALLTRERALQLATGPTAPQIEGMLGETDAATQLPQRAVDRVTKWLRGQGVAYEVRRSEVPR